MLNVRSRTLLFTLSVCLLYSVLLFTPLPTFADRAPQPPQRFDAQIALIDNPLPPEVQIEADGYHLFLHSIGEQPLYLLSRSARGTSLVPDLRDPLPSGWKAEQRILHNQLSFWDTAKQVWSPNDLDKIIILPTDAEIYTSAITIDESTAIVPPSLIDLPPDQFSSFYIAYQSDIYRVSVIIQHIMNPTFDVELQSYLKSLEKAETDRRILFIFAAFILIVVYILPICLGIYLTIRVAKWIIRHLNIRAGKNQQRRDEW